MIVAGIDVGLDGALVINSGAGLTARATPTLGSGKRSYDLQSMRALLSESGAEQVFIERAQAMPGQGVTSMFSTGFGYGIWQGLLAGLGIPFEVVSPQRWQKEMFVGVTAGDTKAASALVAQRLRPDIDWRRTPRCKGPHDGMTDAFCISEYGRRQLALRGAA
jgi:crossover junction endodeoxyribonuclease RuvC